MKNDEPTFGVAGEADNFRMADLNEAAHNAAKPRQGLLNAMRVSLPPQAGLHEDLSGVPPSPPPGLGGSPFLGVHSKRSINKDF